MVPGPRICPRWRPTGAVFTRNRSLSWLRGAWKKSLRRSGNKWRPGWRPSDPLRRKLLTVGRLGLFRSCLLHLPALAGFLFLALARHFPGHGMAPKEVMHVTENAHARHR